MWKLIITVCKKGPLYTLSCSALFREISQSKCKVCRLHLNRVCLLSLKEVVVKKKKRKRKKGTEALEFRHVGMATTTVWCNGRQHLTLTSYSLSAPLSVVCVSVIEIVEKLFWVKWGLECSEDTMYPVVQSTLLVLLVWVTGNVYLFYTCEIKLFNINKLITMNKLIVNINLW